MVIHAAYNVPLLDIVLTFVTFFVPRALYIYSPKITTSADQHLTKHLSIVNNPAVMDHQCRALLENIAFRILHVTIELRRVMVLHLHQSYNPVYPLFRMMLEKISCFVGRNGKMQMQIASNGVGIEVSVLVVKGECYDAQHKSDFCVLPTVCSKNDTFFSLYAVALQIQNATFKM